MSDSLWAAAAAVAVVLQRKVKLDEVYIKSSITPLCMTQHNGTGQVCQFTHRTPISTHVGEHY